MEGGPLTPPERSPGPAPGGRRLGPASHGRARLAALLLGAALGAAGAEPLGTSASGDPLAEAAELRDQGWVREALPLLRQALDQAPDPAARALALGGLSDAWLLLRRLEAAGRAVDRALALARQAGDPAVLAAVLNHRGNLEMTRDTPAAALAHYREGAALAGQAGDPALAAILLTNRVHAHLALGDPAGAAAALEAALEQTRVLPHSRERVQGLIALGELALQLPRSPQRLRQAHTVLAAALEQAAALDERTRSLAGGALAGVYLAAGRPAAARRLLLQALFHAAAAPELAARWHWRLGRLHRRQGDAAAAGAAFRQALDELHRIRPALVFGARGGPRAFRDDLGGVYLDLAELLLDQAAAEAGEIRRQRLLEARRVMEDFKTVELENYYRDACVAAQQARHPDLQLDSLITPGTAVLYPIVLPGRTVLLLSLADGDIRQFDAGVGAGRLRQAAAAFRSGLQRAGNPRRLLAQAQELYDWLIRPLEASLAEQAVHTLVVVPDDLLRTIPFAALHDGRDYLVRRYALAVSPGLTLTEPQAGGGPPAVLLSGLSRGVQGFAELPYVSAELDGIAALYDGGTRLLDETFIEPAVRRELRNRAYSVVGFATHGRFGSEPAESFLLTYDDRITLDELQDLVSLGRFRDRPVELLVLSACETAAGDERAALGLAGVAVKAGARSAMASLWSVNDRSTAELVPAFFESLHRPGITKARALQAAQLALLEQSRYAHPFHWAPFILIGNWR